jgi:hypothetical protein
MALVRIEPLYVTDYRLAVSASTIQVAYRKHCSDRPNFDEAPENDLSAESDSIPKPSFFDAMSIQIGPAPNSNNSITVSLYEGAAGLLASDCLHAPAQQLDTQLSLCLCQRLHDLVEKLSVAYAYISNCLHLDHDGEGGDITSIHQEPVDLTPTGWLIVGAVRRPG